MRKRFLTSALAVTAAVGGLLATAAPAFADDHFDVTVRNTASGKCLTPQGESSAAGVPIVQVTCNGSPFQRWDFVDHDDHIFQIRNAVTTAATFLRQSNPGDPLAYALPRAVK